MKAKITMPILARLEASLRPGLLNLIVKESLS